MILAGNRVGHIDFGITRTIQDLLLTRYPPAAVVALERGPVGAGESAPTTAHLSFALDDRYDQHEWQFGQSGSWAAAQSHQAAVTIACLV
jgi:hypothetical protein